MRALHFRLCHSFSHTALRSLCRAGGRGGGDEDDDTTDLLTDGGQYEEHAREKALMLREAGWRPKDGVWHEAVTAEGYRYFVNQTTGESSWDAQLQITVTW